MYLHLPEGYQHIACTQLQNIYLYYALITVSVIGNVHCVKFILNVPLKTVN
jgi:hypothetical protein